MFKKGTEIKMKNKKDDSIDLKREPVFLIDYSALSGMFNGENKEHSNDFLMKMKEMNDKGMEVKAVTTLSNFLRAIWISNPKATIQNIQKTLSFLNITFSFSDFRREKDVINETIEVAKMISERGKEHGENN